MTKTRRSGAENDAFLWIIVTASSQNKPNSPERCGKTEETLSIYIIGVPTSGMKKQTFQDGTNLQTYH